MKAVQRRHVTSAIRPLRRAALNTTHLIRLIKKGTLKEYNVFTRAIQAKTPKQQTVTDTFKRKEKYPRDSDMGSTKHYREGH